MLRIIAQFGDEVECFLIHGQEDYDMIINLNKYNRHYFTTEHYKTDLDRSVISPMHISIGSLYHEAILNLINYHKEQQINKTLEDVLK